MNIEVARNTWVKKLAEAIPGIGDLDGFLNSLAGITADVFGVSAVSLSLLDRASGEYIRKASYIVGQRKPPENNRLVSLPLRLDKRPIGVLNLHSQKDQEAFSEEELKLLSEWTTLITPLIQQALDYQEISEQRLHHQNILDNLVSGIIAVDPEGKITVFNRTAETILKLKPEQVLGKNVACLQSNVAELLINTLHQGQAYRREELYIPPENTLIGVSSCRFYDAKGELLGACMVFSSLAEIKRTEKLTRQKSLDNYWSNLANSLAHEVKNSIMATKVFMEMFPQKYEDSEFRGDLYSALRRNVEKLNQFSDKVLSFAQAPQLVIQPCQVEEVMEAAIDAVLQDKDLEGIVFEKRYSRNLRPLPGDYHQLKEAFTQILSNALEAMGKKGRLSVDIGMEESPQALVDDLPNATRELPETEIIVVKIKDTGCGILPQHLPNLFDPFFTTKTAQTGLGLASARKIVQRHRGIISAASPSGEGATFWIYLPVLSNEAQTYGAKRM